MDVLEHVENPFASLKEIQRVLKPGGRAFIAFPPYGGMMSHHLDYVCCVPGVHWLFSPQTLVRAVNALLQQDAAARAHGKLQPEPTLSWNGDRYVLPNLNGLTGVQFQRIAAELFEVDSLEWAVVGRNHANGWKRWVHTALKPIAIFGGRPRDAVTASIVSVLRKRVTVGATPGANDVPGHLVIVWLLIACVTFYAWETSNFQVLQSVHEGGPWLIRNAVELGLPLAVALLALLAFERHARKASPLSTLARGYLWLGAFTLAVTLVWGGLAPARSHLPGPRVRVHHGRGAPGTRTSRPLPLGQRRRGCRLRGAEHRSDAAFQRADYAPDHVRRTDRWRLGGHGRQDPELRRVRAERVGRLPG